MNFSLPEFISEMIFRAYDIRGIVEENLTPNCVYAIARAIGTAAKELKQEAIIVGRDGRISGPVLQKALCAGLMESGLNVIDIGSVPTPVLYYATHLLQTNSGVMLTGSHNPREYNGLKIVLGGQTIFGPAIQNLYQRVISKDFITGQGSYTQESITASYIERIQQDLRLLKPLKIVVDCGNGITGDLAPLVYRSLGCEVIELFCEVDGMFPNHHPDPSDAKNLQRLVTSVIKEKADIGLAFDGDGDRLGVVTNCGEIIWPDRQLMLYAIDILSRCKNAVILYDIKCTQHLAAVISQYGGQPLMWKTGHSFIKTKMQETQALLAGEMSGHIFFKERWYGFDDAIYAGARLLEILAATNETASSLFETLPNSVNTPELHIPIGDEQKFRFMEKLIAQAQFKDAKLTKIDGLRVDFEQGWGLIRPSNTTPNLILRFEANTSGNLTQIQEIFREKLLDVEPELALPF